MKKQQKLSFAASTVALLVLLSLIAVPFAYKGVNEGHVGVHKEWGAVTGKTLAPGAHLKMPIRDGVQNVEIRPRTYTMSHTSGEGKKANRDDSIRVTTINGTDVDVDVTIRYRVNAERADEFVTEWNNENQLEKRLIRPTVRSTGRDVAAGITTSDIYTQMGREALERAIREDLRAEMGDEPVVLEAVQVRDVKLPNSYQRQLNAKESAKVQIEKKEYQIQSARKDKQRKLIEAEAEAEANRIVGESLTDEVLADRYIKSLDRTDTVYIPVGEDGLPKFVNATADQEDDDQ